MWTLFLSSSLIFIKLNALSFPSSPRPPFRALMPYPGLRPCCTAGPRLRFACVYIKEAHTSDEWPIKEAPVEIWRHVTLDDRRAVARTLLDHFGGILPFEIYLEGISGPFNATYASWPLRFWVLSEEGVQFKAMPRNRVITLATWTSSLHH